MTLTFDSDGQRVLALISCISGMSAREVDQVTRAWKRGSSGDRARAWARLNRAATEAERYRILAASALARREALETARRLRRTDWAFWAAACDAGAGVAAGARIGRHYDTLVAPFAEIMPALAHSPAAPASAAATPADHQASPDVPAPRTPSDPQSPTSAHLSQVSRRHIAEALAPHLQAES
jgi:hypothetical protein